LEQKKTQFLEQAKQRKLTTGNGANQSSSATTSETTISDTVTVADDLDENAEFSYTVEVSMMEIYNEQVNIMTLIVAFHLSIFKRVVNLYAICDHIYT